MKRPGYLADWEDDLKTYMQRKYKGWQPGTIPYYDPPTRFPIRTDVCPTDYLLHRTHGCIPESAVIEATLRF